MAYDTKVLLSQIAQNVLKSVTLEEAYMSVVESANVEGLQLANYNEAKKHLQELRSRSEAAGSES
ncbi:MAG: hypothetical protein FWG83_00780 [Oscillospiraceae bacterium]|nr:hypothetical protein [Oscillospiraceae bacterium]